jgi:hypothetical protein
MNHLNDFTLNEYLDQTLNETEREKAEAHLQSCDSCHAKLDEFQTVFAELEALPDAPLEHDLTPSILTRLSQKPPVRVWTRAFAAQLGVVVGTFIWLSMQALPFIRMPKFSLPKLPALDIQTLFTRLLALQVPIPDTRFAIPDFRLPALNYQLPTFEIQIPTISIEISTVQLVALSVSVVLLWVIGNAILLRSRWGART